VTRNGSKSIERHDVVESVLRILTTKAQDDGPPAAQLAAVNMIRGALLHVLATEGEAMVWEIMTEIVDNIEQEIRLRSYDCAILH
jgi:N-methylhydantoinase B/oxoprolinase/acetone carboxylase alpha subunit